MNHLSTTLWLSRDIIFLGYNDEFQYSTGIRHFLKEYYEGNDAKFLKGGIIRQALALEFASDDFNSIALQTGNFFVKSRGN